MQNRTNDIVIFLVGSTLLILVLISFIITILYLYRKKQAVFNQSLDALKLTYDKNLLSTQVEIQESTFQHISREIHDNITLELTLAKLKLHTVRLNNTAEAENLINESLVILSRVITDLSDISKSLDSDIITNQGLIKAIEKEIENIRGLKSFAIDMKVTGEPIFLDAKKELIIFRIVQESFNNILKHASARSVQLELYYNFDHIKVTIADDGIGFTAAADKTDSRTGAGLKNIKARADMFNGTVTITGTPGKGTNVVVSIPYSEGEGKARVVSGQEAVVSGEPVEKVDDVSAGG
jgi:two-component system, NarL family, sensor kinase